MMKRKSQRTLDAIFAHPTSANVKWRDIEGVFRELGAEISEREGSRITTGWTGNPESRRPGACGKP